MTTSIYHRHYTAYLTLAKNLGHDNAADVIDWMAEHMDTNHFRYEANLGRGFTGALTDLIATADRGYYFCPRTLQAYQDYALAVVR